jgi:hypothetical protein
VVAYQVTQRIRDREEAKAASAALGGVTA